MTKSPKVSSRKARTATPKPTSKRTRKNKTAPKVVAEKVRGAYRATARKVSAEGVRDVWNTALLEQFPGTQVPNTFRVLAERNVAHTRELYEGSKNTLQAVLESWQKSFGAAGQGAAALNRRLIDLADRNINTGFELATGLAGARNLAEVMELQAAYWSKLLGKFRTHQAARTLSRVRAEIGNISGGDPRDSQQGSSGSPSESPKCWGK
jgi:hypothetical protein